MKMTSVSDSVPSRTIGGLSECIPKIALPGARLWDKWRTTVYGVYVHPPRVLESLLNLRLTDRKIRISYESTRSKCEPSLQSNGNAPEYLPCNFLWRLLWLPYNYAFLLGSWRVVPSSIARSTDMPLTTDIETYIAVFVFNKRLESFT